MRLRNTEPPFRAEGMIRGGKEDEEQDCSDGRQF